MLNKAAILMILAIVIGHLIGCSVNMAGKTAGIIMYFTLIGLGVLAVIFVIIQWLRGEL